MRLATMMVVSSAVALGACAPPTYNPGYSYSKPTLSLRESNIIEAQRNAKWAREAIASGAKQRLTIAEGESSVREGLRDPESARFRDVRRNLATGAVCGYVNAKNAYGGYVGETPFIYYHTPNYSVPQVLASADIATSSTVPAIAAYCPADATTVSADVPAANLKGRRR